MGLSVWTPNLVSQSGQWDDRTSIASGRSSSIPGSPFYRFDLPNGIKILDPSTGKVVFDSVDAGIYKLEETHFLYDQNALIAVGNASIGRNRTIAFIDMESWRASEAIERLWYRSSRFAALSQLPVAFSGQSRPLPKQVSLPERSAVS